MLYTRISFRNLVRICDCPMVVACKIMNLQCDSISNLILSSYHFTRLVKTTVNLNNASTIFISFSLILARSQAILLIFRGAQISIFHWAYIRLLDLRNAKFRNNIRDESTGFFRSDSHIIRIITSSQRALLLINFDNI